MDSISKVGKMETEMVKFTLAVIEMANSIATRMAIRNASDALFSTWVIDAVKPTGSVLGSAPQAIAGLEKVSDDAGNAGAEIEAETAL
jgi:hypothetical protein